MKHTYEYPVDHSSAFLSAFDIGGILLLGNWVCQSKGSQHEMNQLKRDQKNLEEDYRKACTKIIKTLED